MSKFDNLVNSLLSEALDIPSSIVTTPEQDETIAKFEAGIDGVPEFEIKRFYNRSLKQDIVTAGFSAHGVRYEVEINPDGTIRVGPAPELRKLTFDDYAKHIKSRLAGSQYPAGEELLSGGKGAQPYGGEVRRPHNPVAG